MKVVVFGAGGKTGKLIVSEAVTAGHKVTAFLKERKDYPTDADVAVDVVVGDVTHSSEVSAAIAGHDAVIDAIGGKAPYKASHLEQDGAKSILNGMKEHSVRRLIAISMLGVGDSKEQEPWWGSHLLQPTFLRGAAQDKEGMEKEVRQSHIDFTLVRPAFLTDDEPIGSTKVFHGSEKAHKITRADLAQFIVAQLGSDTYVNQAVTVASS
jgi:putative NADH-flavin reductase